MATVEKRKQSSNACCKALGAFFRQHGADIFCVQEHKIPRTQLANKCEPRNAATVEGYESFWSCCVDENSRGMNGVCTYARSGSVCRANASPLGSPELDNQGRCILTDHGEFVLFNVYVPASGGQPLSYKLKFLRALRKAMHHERTKNQKHVILVGDLNITHTALDVYWADRLVYVDRILLATDANSNDLPQWKRDISKHWSSIVAALETLHAVPLTTRNPNTNDEFQKYRAAVNIGDKTVHLGKHEALESYCTMNYEFLNPLVHCDDETGEVRVIREANVVAVGILVELLSKIAGVVWSSATQRDIADNCATVSQASPPRQWLTALLEEDGMVDAFRYYYPKAKGRFTCWHQFTNRRYYNEGIRIDYTLVDRALLDRIQAGTECLRCFSDQEDHHLTEEAALSAATANGRFQPVSFEGGGIQEATTDAIQSQFGDPHTGMIYTPPSFSDHIAISLLTHSSLLRTDLHLDTKDAATKKAQPHKLQKTIASFFISGNGAAAGTSGSKVSRTAAMVPLPVESTAKKAKAKVAPPANSILNHFSKKK